MSNHSPNKSHLLKGFLTLFFVSLLYYPAFIKLIHAWDIKPHASHGYFILPVCIWLCWQRKYLWRNLPVYSSPYGFFILLIGLASYIFGNFGYIDTLTNFSLILTLAGLILISYGHQVLIAYIFPLFFLIFMIPIPDSIYVSITTPMKFFATTISTNLIGFIGIPILQDGNIIRMPNFQMEVVEACSGLRSMTAYVVLGILLSSFIDSTGYFKKIFIVFLTIPIAIICNIFRITLTGLLAEFISQKAANGFFHDLGGLFAFVLGFVLLLAVFKILTKK